MESSLPEESKQIPYKEVVGEKETKLVWTSERVQQGLVLGLHLNLPPLPLNPGSILGSDPSAQTSASSTTKETRQAILQTFVLPKMVS